MSFTEYAQARMQARYGARPAPGLWRELGGIRDLGAYLDALRGTTLRHWVTGIGADGDLHRIEGALRERFRSHVREVSRWMPPPWRPAVLWVAQLPDLPAQVYLLSGRPPLPWMSREPALRALMSDPGKVAAIPARSRLRTSGARPSGAAEHGRACATWLAEWERRWPTTGAESRNALDRIVLLLSAHLERFRLAPARDGWRLRDALDHDLRARFRWWTLRPEACFVYLGLIALDLERLRAQLVRRALWKPEAAA